MENISRSCISVFRLDLSARHDLDELIDGCLLAVGDVDYLIVTRRKRRKVCTCDITDIDEIASLLTVTEDYRCFALQKLIREDRNDTALALRVLTDSENVCIAENRILETVDIRECLYVIFRSKL